MRSSDSTDSALWDAYVRSEESIFRHFPRASGKLNLERPRVFLPLVRDVASDVDDMGSKYLPFQKNEKSADESTLDSQVTTT